MTTVFRILTHEPRPASVPQVMSSWSAWIYSLFVLTLVPIYLFTYGPTNFCYFCDLALLLTALTVWTGHALPASMAAVAILVPQTLWIIDFLAHLGGWRLIGMTDYMFDSGTPLGLRALSLFHLWLPPVLVVVLQRMGYDRRAFAAWLPCGLVILLVSRWLLPAPPAPTAHPEQPVNINLVFGLSDRAAQTWMPGWAWFLLLCTLLVGAAWWPTHLLLTRYLPQKVSRTRTPACAAGPATSRRTSSPST